MHCSFVYRDEQNIDFATVIQSDTIAAIATASGVAGVAIVRISGPESLAVLRRVFHRPLMRRLIAGRMLYGHVRDPGNGEIVDEVFAWYQPGPFTYSREPMAEIQCHGGEAMPRRVLAVVLAAGARIAEPGEFTLRAFLNGRIDLAQVEAVLDIVTARTEAAATIALLGGDGRLSRAIREIREEIIGLLAHVTATIDFPEDDVQETASTAALTAQVKSIVSRLQRMMETFQTGRRYREGARVSIVGRPNVGKSSLLNALAGHDRAIVSDVAGTTRDTIEELIEIDGVPIVVTDTAGLHESSDPVEKLGIARTYASAESSDLVLLVIDSSVALTSEDFRIMRGLPPSPIVCVLNKSDLKAVVDSEIISDARLDLSKQVARTVRVSSSTHEGLDKLRKSIIDALSIEPNRVSDAILITNSRHFSQLERASVALSVLYEVNNGIPGHDVFASALHDAADALGLITGETATDDVLKSIFIRFCVGK